MKSLLLAALLAAAATAPAAAQNAAKPTVAPQHQTDAQAIEPKMLFASRVNELDAYLTRNRTEEVQRLFGQLMQSMSEMTPAGKQEQVGAMMAEIKVLSLDMKANQTAIIAKLREYLQMI